MNFNDHPYQTPSSGAIQFSVDLFDFAPIPLIVTDQSGVIVRVNSAEQNLLGYTATEMHGKHAWEFVIKEEQDISRERFKAFVEGMELLPSHRRHFITKSNEYLICELSAQIVRDERSGERYVLLASIDVTRQVKDARNRGEIAQWMEASFRSSCDATLVIDTIGRIRFLNRAAEKLLGWAESECIGHLPEDIFPWTNLLSSDGRISTYSFEEGVSSTWSGTAIFATKGGVKKHLKIRTTPVIASNGIVLGIAGLLSPIE